MLLHFKPKAGDFGAEFITMERGGIVSLTASATTNFMVGSIAAPSRSLYLDSVVMVTRLAVTGGSTILVTFKKKNGATAVTLNAPAGGTAALGDIKSLVADVGVSLTFSTQNSLDSDRVFNPGDCLIADVVAAGTVTQQPTDLTFIATFKVLK